MKIKLVTFSVLIALLLVSGITFLAAAVTESSFPLSSSSSQLLYTLPAGTTFNGSIATTGTLRFWVNDPNQSQIVNLGLIDKTTTFSFTAQQNGTYTLNFENDLSNQITVTFSYTTNPDLSGNNPTGPSNNYIIISIIVTVVGSILIIVFARLYRRRKQK